VIDQLELHKLVPATWSDGGLVLCEHLHVHGDGAIDLVVAGAW
jgi:hypothetical protein